MSKFRCGRKVRLRPEACKRVLTVRGDGPDSLGDVLVDGLSRVGGDYLPAELLELVPEPRLLGPDTVLHNNMEVMDKRGTAWRCDVAGLHVWWSAYGKVGTPALYGATIRDGNQ